MVSLVVCIFFVLILIHKIIQILTRKSIQPYNGKDGIGLTVAVEAENDQIHGVAGDVRANEQVEKASNTALFTLTQFAIDTEWIGGINSIYSEETAHV